MPYQLSESSKKLLQQKYPELYASWCENKYIIRTPDHTDGISDISDLNRRQARIKQLDLRIEHECELVFINDDNGDSFSITIFMLEAYAVFRKQHTRDEDYCSARLIQYAMSVGDFLKTSLKIHGAHDATHTAQPTNATHTAQPTNATHTAQLTRSTNAPNAQPKQLDDATIAANTEDLKDATADADAKYYQKQKTALIAKVMKLSTNAINAKHILGCTANKSIHYFDHLIKSQFVKMHRGDFRAFCNDLIICELYSAQKTDISHWFNPQMLDHLLHYYVYGVKPDKKYTVHHFDEPKNIPSILEYIYQKEKTEPTRLLIEQLNVHLTDKQKEELQTRYKPLYIKNIEAISQDYPSYALRNIYLDYYTDDLLDQVRDILRKEKHRHTIPKLKFREEKRGHRIPWAQVQRSAASQFCNCDYCIGRANRSKKQKPQIDDFRLRLKTPRSTSQKIIDSDDD